MTRPKRVRTKKQIALDIEEQAKQCRNCDERKPFSEYTTSKLRSDGRHSVCKKCCQDYHQEWRDENPSKIREQTLRNRYGIDQSIFDSMLEQQQHRCAVCGSMDAQRKDLDKLVIDHCHESGKVRGLLCHNCNAGLGHFKDNPQWLMSAVRYLTSYKV